MENTSQRPGSVSWPFFSFPVALGFIIAMCVVLTVRSRFSDPDMWWHLKAGQLIWTTHHVPVADSFSFSVAGQPWIAQEWLSEVSIYAAWLWGGYTGLMLWMCLMASLVLVGGYALCSLYSGNPKLSFVGAFLIWLFSSVGMSVRPHLAGYVCMVLELLLLHQGTVRSRRWFYGLPVVFALWINLHSSFFFGLFILGAFGVCAFVDLRVGFLASASLAPERRRALLFASAASLAALFVNPIGLKLIWYPVDILLRQGGSLGRTVTEWLPPQFDSVRSDALLVVAALILLVPLLRKVDIALREVLLVGAVFFFAVQHERMLFLFGLLAAPVLCRLLADTWDNYDPAKDRNLPNLIAIAIAITVSIVAFPSRQDLVAQVNEGNPVRALAFIRQAGLAGRMLNDYTYGGYLIWEAPERKVFIDGRTDVYEAAGVMSEYTNWYELQADPSGLPDHYGVQYCLLPQAAPITRVLRRSPDWKAAYTDPSLVVLVRVSR